MPLPRFLLHIFLIYCWVVVLEIAILMPFLVFWMFLMSAIGVENSEIYTGADMLGFPVSLVFVSILVGIGVFLVHSKETLQTRISLAIVGLLPPVLFALFLFVAMLPDALVEFRSFP